MSWARIALIVCIITDSIPMSLGQQTASTLDLGALSFSTVPIATPLQSTGPNATVNVGFLTVQETAGWISSPNQQLLSALESQYASVSASPVAEQVAQISSTVSDATSAVQKRGVVLLLPLVYYTVIYTMIGVALLAKAARLQSGVYVNTPGALGNYKGNPAVLKATVDGEVVSATISSAIPSGATATISTASQLSGIPWPCAGGSCRASNDPISGDPPYTCNVPGKSGDPCAIVYSDEYSYVPIGTSFALGITTISSLLASVTAAGYDPYSTIAPTACQLTSATNTCQGQPVCLCNEIYTLPRTATSGGSTITDCSYTLEPTEYSCPTGTCSLGYNPQSSPYCTCGGGVEQTDLSVGAICGTTTVPPPASTPPTMTASPTPAPTACVGTGPQTLSASVMDFYISPYCSGVENKKQNGETLNVTRTWPGTCALQLNDKEAIIASVSLDTTNEYCSSMYSDQNIGAFFSKDDCNTAMSVDVNGCDEKTTSAKHGGWTSINCVKMAWWVGAPGQAAPCTEVPMCPPNKDCCPPSGCIGL